MTNIEALKAIAKAAEALGDRADIVAAFAILKARDKALQGDAARAFVPGERVTFHARGMHVTGTVEKTNRTSVTVREDRSPNIGSFPQKIWRVSPSLLRPAVPEAK